MAFKQNYTQKIPQYTVKKKNEYNTGMKIKQPTMSQSAPAPVKIRAPEQPASPARAVIKPTAPPAPSIPKPAKIPAVAHHTAPKSPVIKPAAPKSASMASKFKPPTESAAVPKRPTIHAAPIKSAGGVQKISVKLPQGMQVPAVRAKVNYQPSVISPFLRDAAAVQRYYLAEAARLAHDDPENNYDAVAKLIQQYNEQRINPTQLIQGRNKPYDPNAERNNDNNAAGDGAENNRLASNFSSLAIGVGVPATIEMILETARQQSAKGLWSSGATIVGRKVGEVLDARLPPAVRGVIQLENFAAEPEAFGRNLRANLPTLNGFKQKSAQILPKALMDITDDLGLSPDNFSRLPSSYREQRKQKWQSSASPGNVMKYVIFDRLGENLLANIPDMPGVYQVNRDVLRRRWQDSLQNSFDAETRKIVSDLRNIGAGKASLELPIPDRFADQPRPKIVAPELRRTGDSITAFLHDEAPVPSVKWAELPVKSGEPLSEYEKTLRTHRTTKRKIAALDEKIAKATKRIEELNEKDEEYRLGQNISSPSRSEYLRVHIEEEKEKAKLIESNNNSITERNALQAVLAKTEKKILEENIKSLAKKQGITDEGIIQKFLKQAGKLWDDYHNPKDKETAEYQNDIEKLTKERTLLEERKAKYRTNFVRNHKADYLAFEAASTHMAVLQNSTYVAPDYHEKGEDNYNKTKAIVDELDEQFENDTREITGQIDERTRKINKAEAAIQAIKSSKTNAEAEYKKMTKETFGTDEIIPLDIPIDYKSNFALRQLRKLVGKNNELSELLDIIGEPSADYPITNPDEASGTALAAWLNSQQSPRTSHWWQKNEAIGIFGGSALFGAGAFGLFGLPKLAEYVSKHSNGLQTNDKFSIPIGKPPEPSQPNVPIPKIADYTAETIKTAPESDLRIALQDYLAKPKKDGWFKNLFSKKPAENVAENVVVNAENNVEPVFPVLNRVAPVNSGQNIELPPVDEERLDIDENDKKPKQDDEEDKKDDLATPPKTWVGTQFDNIGNYFKSKPAQQPEQQQQPKQNIELPIIKPKKDEDEDKKDEEEEIKTTKKTESNNKFNSNGDPLDYTPDPNTNLIKESSEYLSQQQKHEQKYANMRDERKPLNFQHDNTEYHQHIEREEPHWYNRLLGIPIKRKTVTTKVERDGLKEPLIQGNPPRKQANTNYYTIPVNSVTDEAAPLLQKQNKHPIIEKGEEILGAIGAPIQNAVETVHKKLFKDDVEKEEEEMKKSGWQIIHNEKR